MSGPSSGPLVHGFAEGAALHWLLRNTVLPRSPRFHMTEPDSLLLLYRSALQLDGAGSVKDVDRALWAQAEELRRALGRPFPDDIARLRDIGGQRSAWHWHNVLPAVVGREAFHRCLADIKARALPAFALFVEDHPVIVGAIEAERAYAVGEISSEERIAALDGALELGDRMRFPYSHAPMFAARAAGARGIRDAASNAAKAEGWRAAGHLGWGAERDAAIASVQEEQFIEQIAVIARCF